MAKIEIALWDDNPSSVDLLGFDAVASPGRAESNRISGLKLGRIWSG